MSRSVITFLTDFGPDAAAAICRGVMLSIAPEAAIVDISHSVRKYAIRDGAFLLWCSIPWMPVGVHLAVVDPGVGTERRPLAILAARGDILVGPDNGLLVPAAERLGGIREVRALENRDLWLAGPSSTFHGRDVFAPVAAHLANGAPFESVGPLIDPASIERLEIPRARRDGDALASSVIYIDSFGNARLAGDPAELAGAVGPLLRGRLLLLAFGPIEGAPGSRIEVPWVRTFGDVAPGGTLLYEDSFGRLALAVNQGSAAAELGLALDRAIRITAA